MGKVLESKYILYVCFFLMLFTMLFVKNVCVEPIERGAIMQVLHPEHPKGPLVYDPHHNYDYIFAFVAERLGYRDNFADLAGLFWFLEIGLAIIVLTKLCNYIFKGDRTVLVIAVMLFILLRSGQTDQKTMLQPLYLLAVYYFLKEKWFVSALFTAAIFYLHVAVAIWWFLPSCFAMWIMWLLQKRVSPKQIMIYALTTLAVASPVVFFYTARAGALPMDSFSIQYYFYECWQTTSVLLMVHWPPTMLIGIAAMTGILLVGYKKAIQPGYAHKNIMPVAAGVLLVYVVNLIFSDILRDGTAITLQLLRSFMYVQWFAFLYFAFLLAQQIKRGNYFFFIIIVLLSSSYSYLKRFLGGANYYNSLYVFYAFFLLYEINEGFFIRFAEKIRARVTWKPIPIAARNAAYSCWRFMRKPAVIAVFFVFITVFRTGILKSYIKSALGMAKEQSATAEDYLHGDIAHFTNEKLTDKDTLLVTPFLEIDFMYYTKHKTFINCFTPIQEHTYEGIPSKTFEYILGHDLNSSLEQIFVPEKFRGKNFYTAWNKMWHELDEEIIRSWKQRYGVTHVIREKDLPLDFPVIYENEEYRVYEIK